jgi:hypothetical protein
MNTGEGVLLELDLKFGQAAARRVCLAIAIFSDSASAADDAGRTLDYLADYRSRIFLTNGIDMTDDASGRMADHCVSKIFHVPYLSLLTGGQLPFAVMSTRHASSTAAAAPASNLPALPHFPKF